MKAIQVMMDERLLATLDDDPEVQAGGRSAAIRTAVEVWLRARRTRGLDDSYARGYAGSRGLGAEWSGWADEGEWPAE
jgi:metal-responsive CopG/Arc/MetJ family transcriptional regulator